jgi:hypothetical protein
MPSHAEALGDGNGTEKRPIQLKRLDLGVEVAILLMKLEKPIVDLGSLDHLVEVLELLGFRWLPFRLPVQESGGDEEEKRWQE